MDLNGKWTLYYSPEGSRSIVSVTGLAGSGIPSVGCTVPGNVELDLSAAGILPEDLFMGENILEAQKYETYSMGNFFFPREGERGKSWDYGYCSELEITEAGVSLSVHPYRFGSQELTLLQGGRRGKGSCVTLRVSVNPLRMPAVTVAL